MREMNTRPDVRETGNRTGRIEPLPRERFGPDPNKPCDNIRQVVPVGTSMYRVYDTKSQIPVDSLTKLYGDYVKHGKDYILFEKVGANGNSIQYTACDSKMKRLGQQNSGVIGKFVGMAGENMTFEKSNMYYTYDRNLQPVKGSHPIPKPRS